MKELESNSRQDPVYITTAAKRKRVYPHDITFQLNLLQESREWYKIINDKNSFTFKTYRSGADLFSELQTAIVEKNEEKVQNVLLQMDPLLIKGSDERTDKEKWDHASLQLPEDWGLRGENRKKAKNLLTSRAKGRVLEAMCGFNSYFGTSTEIEEIVALDFSEKALERYEYPERTRILYDIERICQGEKIEFFDDNSFQTIGVFFGMDYLTDPLATYLEFGRILQKGGEVLVVGGTASGYSDILKRYFRPDYHTYLMKKAGLSANVTHLPLKQALEVGEYYLIAGVKK